MKRPLILGLFGLFLATGLGAVIALAGDRRESRDAPSTDVVPAGFPCVVNPPEIMPPADPPAKLAKRKRPVRKADQPTAAEAPSTASQPVVKEAVPVEDGPVLLAPVVDTKTEAAPVEEAKSLSATVEAAKPEPAPVEEVKAPTAPVDTAKWEPVTVDAAKPEPAPVETPERVATTEEMPPPPVMPPPTPVTATVPSPPELPPVLEPAKPQAAKELPPVADAKPQAAMQLPPVPELAKPEPALELPPMDRVVDTALDTPATPAKLPLPTTTGRSESNSPADPTALLRHARQLYVRGKLVEAEALARHVATMPAKWSPGQDSPAKLIADVQRSRQAIGKATPATATQPGRFAGIVRRIGERFNGDTPPTQPQTSQPVAATAAPAPPREPVVAPSAVVQASAETPQPVPTPAVETPLLPPPPTPPHAEAAAETRPQPAPVSPVMSPELSPVPSETPAETAPVPSNFASQPAATPVPLAPPAAPPPPVPAHVVNAPLAPAPVPPAPPAPAAAPSASVTAQPAPPAPGAVPPPPPAATTPPVVVPAVTMPACCECPEQCQGHSAYLAAYVGFAIVKPYVKNNPAFFVSNGTNPIVARQIEFGPGAQFAPEISVGVVGPDDWGFRTSWWGFATSDTQTATGNARTVTAWPLGLGLTSTSSADRFVARAELGMTVWDNELTRDFRGNSWVIQVAGGVRYAHIAQRFDALQANGIGTNALVSGHNFDGIGPTLFARGRWQVCGCRLYVFGTGRASLLYGRASQDAGVALATGSRVVAETTSRMIMPVGEMEMGFGYRRLFDGIDAFVELGLDYQVWIEAGNASRSTIQSNPLVTQPGGDYSTVDYNLGLLALTMRLGINY